MRGSGEGTVRGDAVEEIRVLSAPLILAGWLALIKESRAAVMSRED